MQISRQVLLMSVLMALPAGMGLPGKAKSETMAEVTTPAVLVEQFVATAARAENATALQETIATLFDVEAMSKMIVGRLTWRDWTGVQQHAFVDRMTLFIATMIVSRREQEAEPATEIFETREGPSGTQIVSTRSHFNGEPVRVDYHLRDKDGVWTIVDIVADAKISEVARRRAEFSSIILAQGHAGILAALEQKIRQMEPTGG
ncbi:MAG: ABC transporter substrate-binding protein [Parvibaculum sp.]